ncbi:MAG: SDR family NAD(P)-dependent oxidoreductase [Candidatus Pristimantibacillus sp.]
MLRLTFSSLAGILSTTTNPSYSASKGAIRAASKEVAASYEKDRIRVNTVFPGTISTPMIKNEMENKQIKSMVEANTPLRRLGNTDDIAYGVLYFASDESAFVTGAELVIDGGYSIQ